MFEIRLRPGQDGDALFKSLREGILDLSGAMPALNVAVELTRMSPGLDLPESHELTKLCLDSMTEAGIAPSVARLATCTEAGQFFSKGYDAVAFGPGDPAENGHGPNEQNSMDQIAKATTFYERLIEKVCV